MTYLYRGTSLSSANEEEFETGTIQGFSAGVYTGQMDMADKNETVVKGTPIDQLQWFRPEGFDGVPYMTDSQPVTGGVTDRIGAAIGFSGGIPIVLYLREGRLSPNPQRIRYSVDYFDAVEGAAAWVYGDNAEGEIRDTEDGLLGITTPTESGPAVWEWGDRDLRTLATTYEDEAEYLAQTESIDISGACAGVAVVLEGRRSPEQALSTFPDYHAGYGSSGTDISRWSEREVLDTLHAEIRQEAVMDLPTLWTLNLTTNIQEKVTALPAQSFDFAFDGTTVYDDIEDVPGFITGL